MPIVVKYYNRRMLLTLDLNALVEAIMNKYGDGTMLHFAPMTEQERADTTDETGVMNAVRERFWILEVALDGRTRRQTELEIAAVGDPGDIYEEAISSGRIEEGGKRLDAWEASQPVTQWGCTHMK